MSLTTDPTHSSTEVQRSLHIVEVKPGVKFGEQTLIDWLPDIETALFFSMVFELDHEQVSRLIKLLFNTSLVDALTSGDHSHDLQDFIVDIAHQGKVKMGDVSFGHTVPKGEILPEMWLALQIEVAQSIRDVANKMQATIGLLPGKKGAMMFGHLMKANRLRPTVGSYEAYVKHAPQKQNLVILDDSGSMSEATIRALIEDVVALGYMADAGLALVSNTCRYWAPGAYSVDSVLAQAEYSGTHYEELEELLNQDWGTVITVADYDSSESSRDHLVRKCSGVIDDHLDISLVNTPTFLAECVGRFAKQTRPILVAAHDLRRG